MLAIRDNIHYNTKKVDGYNKPFTYVVSAREAGKSVCWVLDKAYRAFIKEGRTSVICRRNVADITEAYILSIQFIINKFADENVKLEFSASDLKNGVVYVKINGLPFLAIVALNVKIARLKSLIIPNLKFMIFDEFIINPEFGETYLKKEVERFKEIYTTYRRECAGVLRCYFFGNAYTRYNPYFIDTGVDINEIKPGTIIAGDDYVIESYQICDELYQKLKAENPFYSRDDAYSSYALNGSAVNDEKIKICKQPNGFKLFCVFAIDSQIIAVYKNPNVSDDKRFFCSPATFDVSMQNIICFDLSELLNEGRIMFDSSNGIKFMSFNVAFRKNLVYYKDINTYYLVKEIYHFL